MNKITAKHVYFLLFALLSACESDRPSSALGTVERDRIILKATASEIIIAQPIREGEFVERGQLLVELDDRRQQARVSKASAENVRAAAYWEALRNGARVEDIDAATAEVNGAQATLIVAEKNYQRTLELRRKNLSAQVSVDQALAQRDFAEAALDAASKHLLALTNGTRKEELDQAEAAFNATQAQLELEQYQLEELKIVATRDGYLDSLTWNTGERVLAGGRVGVLLVGEHAYARVYVPEPWRAKLAVGDQLSVNVDGVEKPFVGRLRWISSEPAFTPYYALNERDRTRLVYLAEVELDGSDGLALGVPAEVLFHEH
ncbi:HlyD family secretion protein [Teredinibacter haidensis]|uniref:HlyD family secretion protein n=1 Tax=Teredinibacter haidensis TaxID=2731755 RepID=UPI0009489EDF|nr:HlyD family efflux transporter periplasmic adaptor subunit [Teredinibacter haidensis]